MMTFVALGYINDTRSRNRIKNKTSYERFQIHQSCYLIDFFIFVFQACAPRYVYYIFMDRMDPVGVCYSARNACSEKRPQIRHHRPCVESGKAMRSKTKISCPRCANVYFFLLPPFSNPHVCQLSVSLSRALYQLPVKPPPNIGMCSEVSLVLAQLQTS